MARSRFKSGVLLAALTAAGACGVADTAGAAEDFPRGRDETAVAQWLAANTRMPLEAVVLAGPELVSAVAPLSGQPAVAGGRRVRVIQEVVDAGFVKVMGGRSAVLDLEVDCDRARIRRETLAVHPGSDLSGPAQRLGPAADWSSPAEPGTPMQVIVEAACEPRAAVHPLAHYRIAWPAQVAARPAAAAPAPAPLKTVAVATPPPVIAPAGPSARPQAAPVRPPAGRAPMVDLGTFDSLASARAAWGRAVSGASGRVQRIELAAGPSLSYRALIDGFGSAAEAEAACAAYRARGGVCSLR